MVAASNLVHEIPPVMDATGKVMKFKIKIVINETVLIRGQAGVNALLPVVKVSKLGRDRVKVTIVVRSLRRDKIVSGKTA